MPEVYQCTISGKDAGGFSFENVFHIIDNYAGDETIFHRSGILATLINTDIVGAYTACMCEGSKLLNIGVRGIYPVASFTNSAPIDAPGTRIVSQAVGGTCGRIGFVPGADSNFISSMFIPCCAQDDFVEDIIQAAYLTLLETLGDAFLLFDGSEVTYFWQLCQFHKATDLTSDLDEFFVSSNPTLMNKRVRA